MNPSLSELISEVDNLIVALEAKADARKSAIDKVADEHREGAVNLVHYAEMRARDIRPIQAGLANVGATRLSTAEPAVMARLHAARNVLSAYAGEPLKYGAGEVAEAFAKADDVLDAHSNRLLGPAKADAHSRIMVTLPSEAAADPSIAAEFAAAGMDLARINCAHDDAVAWKAMVDNVNAAAQAVGRDIRIAMDLAGPKVRTGDIAAGPAVARARVLRNVSGEVIQPARIWMAAENSDMEMPAEVAELPGRPVLPVRVEQRWLDNLAEGQEVSCFDNRNRSRSFTVTRVFSESTSAGPSTVQGVLVEGDRSAYISNQTIFRADYLRTRVFGIPPTEQRLRLHVGDRLILTDAEVVCYPTMDGSPRISCTLPEAIQAVSLGDPVMFDDGAIAGTVVDKSASDDGHVDVVIEVTRAKPGGTNLAAHKGINFPATDMPLPSLTSEDVDALQFVTEHAHVANVSFVRRADDVRYLLDKLEEIAESSADPQRAREIGLVLKIETIPAYNGLADVLLEGMRHPNLGVMIARGDLAVELGFARMAEVPTLITQMCESAHVPVILATQVLENMAKTGLPSRAEITDAAFALRTEAVMLNKGPHVTDAIKVLDHLSKKLGQSQRKNRQMLRKIVSWSEGQS